MIVHSQGYSPPFLFTRNYLGENLGDMKRTQHNNIATKVPEPLALSEVYYILSTAQKVTHDHVNLDNWVLSTGLIM